MSRETTLTVICMVRDKAELGLPACASRFAEDLQRKGYVGKTIGIKLRFDDFKSVTRDMTIAHYTADAAEIRRIAGQCLKRARCNVGSGCWG